VQSRVQGVGSTKVVDFGYFADALKAAYCNFAALYLVVAWCDPVQTGHDCWLDPAVKDYRLIFGKLFQGEG